CCSLPPAALRARPPLPPRRSSDLVPTLSARRAAPVPAGTRLVFGASVTGGGRCLSTQALAVGGVARRGQRHGPTRPPRVRISRSDRKSTRLNSSHVKTSDAVFCME